MQSTRRFLAFAVLGAAGLVPALVPGQSHAQADAGADDLMKRLRGAPGSRVGGATRGIKRDHPAEATTPAPGTAAVVPATNAPARVAGATGG